MSFYLRKNTDSKAIMHITKGHRTPAQLRSGILSDTVFHSDLPYIQYTAYKATLVPVSIGITSISHALSIPETVLTAMDSQVYCYLVEHNGVIKLYETYLPDMPGYIVDGGSWLDAIYSLLFFTDSTYSGISVSRDATYRVPLVSLANPSEVTNVWVVVLDTGTTHTTNTSESLYIGKGRLDVDGTSLATYRYITSAPVNNIDPIVYTPNGDPIQFINFYTDAETALSITSDSGRTVIKNGDKALFDSGIDRGKIIFDKIDVIHFPGYNSPNVVRHTRPIAEGLQNGDLFSFYTVNGGEERSYNILGLGVFHEDTAISIYEKHRFLVYQPPPDPETGVEPEIEYVYQAGHWVTLVCNIYGQLVEDTQVTNQYIWLNPTDTYVTYFK